jgi:hypothetical protein
MVILALVAGAVKRDCGPLDRLYLSGRALRGRDGHRHRVSSDREQSFTVVISIVAMFVLRLGSKQTVPLQMAGNFHGALLRRSCGAGAGDLRPLYPQSWIADMMASATADLTPKFTANLIRGPRFRGSSVLMEEEMQNAGNQRLARQSLKKR